jgi:hypothetical protein
MSPFPSWTISGGVGGISLPSYQVSRTGGPPPGAGNSKKMIAAIG